MFKSAETIVAVSTDMSARLIELGASSSKIRQVCYGVDLSALPTRAKPDSHPIFVAVGRFVEKKAPFLTCIAFGKILDLYPNAELEFVGDGPLLSVCKDLARGLGIVKKINFRGRLDHEPTLILMATATCFVQHSVTAHDGDSEGTPNTVLEASALGLPIVSTRHAGISDVVLDGETGYLVAEFDVDGMAREMIKIIEDPEKAKELGANGRARIQKVFNQRNQIAKLHRVLVDVAVSPKGL